MELPHEPRIYNHIVINANSDRVSMDDLHDFVSAVEGMPDTSGKSMEVWSYMSDVSALMVGMPSWVLGPGITNIEGLLPFSHGQEIGLEFDLICTDPRTSPGQVMPNQLKMFFAEVSFLHYDTETSTPTIDSQTNSGHPELWVYVNGVEVGTEDNNYNHMDGSGWFHGMSDPAFPFLGASHEEGIELINTGNIIEELICDGEHLNTVSIVVKCDRSNGADCTSEDYAYVSDIKFRQMGVGNCGSELEVWSAPQIVGDVHPYLKQQLPPEQTAIDEDMLYINPEWFYAPYYSAPYNYPYPVTYTMAFPLSNSWWEVQNFKANIAQDPTMQSHSVCFPMTIERIDIDTEVRANITYGSGHLSRSNVGYRLFSTIDPVKSLDGAMVRYSQQDLTGDLSSDSPYDTDTSDYESYKYFDPIALARLQMAVTDAVYDEGQGSDVSLSYIETNSWHRDVDERWVQDILDISQHHTNGIIGGYFSLGWWREASDTQDDCCGEFTERTGLHNLYDINQTVEDVNHPDYILNDTTTVDDDPNDNWELFLYYPNDRKQDAVPGWSQSWSTTIQVSPEEEVTFDWAVSACSECSGDDTVIEVFCDDGNGNPCADLAGVSQSLSQYWELDSAASDATSPLTGFPTPEPSIAIGDGFWEVSVVMYTIKQPKNQRQGWFRLVANDGVTTFSPQFGWNYRSGVLGEDLTTPTVSVSPINNTDTFSAASRFMWIENCIGYLFTGDPNWDSQCRSSR